MKSPLQSLHRSKLLQSSWSLHTCDYDDEQWSQRRRRVDWHSARCCRFHTSPLFPLQGRGSAPRVRRLGGNAFQRVSHHAAHSVAAQLSSSFLTKGFSSWSREISERNETKARGQRSKNSTFQNIWTWNQLMRHLHLKQWCLLDDLLALTSLMEIHAKKHSWQESYSECNI